MFKNAVIMAAGKGTRMWPLTEYIPKALIKVHKEELINYSIKLLNSIYPDVNVHVTVGYKMDMVAAHVLKKELCVKSIINTSDSNNGWWLFNTALQHLDEPIIVLTCDSIMNIDFDKLYEDYVKLEEPACMIVGTTLDFEIDADSICKLDNNYINYIGREKKSNFFATGCQIINPYKINKLLQRTDNFNDIWKQLQHINQLKCSNVTPYYWTSFEDLNQIIELPYE